MSSLSSSEYTLNTLKKGEYRPYRWLSFLWGVFMQSTRFLISATAVLGCLASLQAQEITGNIRGTVSDPSGALIPGATVIVINLDTNLEVRHLTTNKSGAYVAPLLPVGTYEIDVESSGFKRSSQKGIVVNVSDRLEENISLALGDSSQTVEVSDTQLQVQTQNASAESLISGEQVRALPTNNRNYEQLVALQPGVSGNVPDQLFVGVYNYKNQTNVASFSIGGGRDSQNNWTIDGADNVDRGSNKTLLNYPSVDAIEEFKLLRGTYNAEYGRGAAGQVEVITRSGGSKFHGGVYEFFRNDALDANSFFNKRNAVGKTPLRYNDFGGTFGGPVMIPGLLHPAIQRTHFFFSEEIRRIKTPVPLNAEVPTIALRNGIFPYPVCTAADAKGNCTSTSSNITPTPAAAAYIKDIFNKLPAPQATSDPFSLFSAQSATFNYQEELYRLDHSFSDRFTVMGRFLNDKIPTQEPGGLFTNANLPGVSQTSTNAPGKSWMARVTWAITPTLYNEGGYAYSYGAIISQPNGLDNAALSPDVLPTLKLPFASTLTRIPDLGFADFESVTGFGQYLDYNRNHNIFDNLSLVRGNHSYKFGGSFNHYNKQENSAGNSASPANGSFSFDETNVLTDAKGNCIGGGSDINCGAYQNWANFLLGSASGFTQQSKDLTADIRENTFELYGQDEWRIRPTLTVSYGVRYSLFDPPTDGGGILSNFAPSTFSPQDAPRLDSSGLLVTNTGKTLNGIVLGGKNSPYGNGVESRSYSALGPRVGVAFDPAANGKTSVRLGYGIFQEALLAGLWEAAIYENPPYNTTTNFNSTTLANPAGGSASTNLNPPGLIGFAEKWHPSYAQQFSLDFQHELAPNLVIDAGYYGQHGVHLVGQRDINEVPPGAALAAGISLPLRKADAAKINALRPYQGYGAISIYTPSYSSNYNSLQTQITKRFTDGSTLTANYTWSHALTDNQTASGTQTFDTYHPERDYGNTQLDRKHIFNADYVYKLPFFRNSRSLGAYLLGGWETTGILAADSGLPLTVFQSSSNGDAAGLGIYDSSGLGSTARPNLVSSPNANAPHTLDRWFNVFAFANNKMPGQDGTEHRGAVRGPGFWKLDTAVDKSFRITESTSFSLRIAAYNVTNSTSFSAVRTTGLSTAANPVTQSGYGTSFGNVTATHDPRILQLAGRISF